ncbi:MAG TPA: DUF2231 domain-containing protein [Rhabdochlamydiaceae bacterium]|jgi:uncharacterized membrane protein
MRIELLHPILVHFPLALLLVGTLVKAIAFFVRRRRIYSYLTFASWLLLSIGVLFAWLSVGAGEMAEDVVRKKLCLPDVLDDHRLSAYLAALLFTTALLFDWGRVWTKRYVSVFTNKLLALLGALLFLIAACSLITAGYFGGSLVFKQGAAVEKSCEIMH